MVLSRQVLLKNEKGEPVSIIVINKDITRRKQAEEALQRARCD